MLKWIFLLILLIAALGGTGYYLWPRFHPAAPKWKTEKITRAAMTITVTATGTVAPLLTVQIGAQISGIVKDVLKQSNDNVKSGDVLAHLDTDLLESEKRSAEVHLSQAHAAMSILKVERENLALRELRQKASIERKEVTVKRSKGTRDLAVKNRESYQALIKVNATSQTELDIKLLEEANAIHDTRLMEIDLEQAGVDEKQILADGRQLDAKEEQARADILEAEAVLARAKTNLGYATILSPIDGVVLQHLIEPGQTIAASFQTPNLFKIASDLSHIRIDAQLDEADIGKIKIKQDVTFDVDAYRGETFIGQVSIIHLQSETKGNLVTYPVQVEASNPSDSDHPYGKLLPGMTAGMKFVVDRRKDALLLPSAALRFIPPPGSAPASVNKEFKDGKKGTHGTVFVANALGLLEPRTVRVGENDGDNFEILNDELKEGDDVVIGVK